MSIEEFLQCITGLEDWPAYAKGGGGEPTTAATSIEEAKPTIIYAAKIVEAELATATTVEIDPVDDPATNVAEPRLDKDYIDDVSVAQTPT